MTGADRVHADIDPLQRLDEGAEVQTRTVLE